MVKPLVLLALLLTALLGSSCARESRNAPTSTAEISLTAIPYPAAVGDSQLVIRVTDASGKPISDAVILVKADMTHAGMVPVQAQTSQGGDQDGYYSVPFTWTMAGDWIVTVEAVLRDGTRVKQRFDYAVLTEDEAVCTDEDPQE